MTYYMSGNMNIYAEQDDHGQYLGEELYEKLRNVSEDVTAPGWIGKLNKDIIHKYDIELPEHLALVMPKYSSVALKCFFDKYIDEIENEATNVVFNMSFEDIWR